MYLLRQFSMASLLLFYSMVSWSGLAVAAWIEETVMPSISGPYAVNITQSGSIYLAQTISGNSIFTIFDTQMEKMYINQAILTNQGWGVPTQEAPVSDGFFNYPKIEVDQNGAIHLLYDYISHRGDHPSRTTNTTYITNKSGAWQTEIISEYNIIRSDDVDLMTADAQSKVHLISRSYPNSSKTPVMLYTSNQSGSWKTETVYDQHQLDPSDPNFFFKTVEPSTLTIDNEGYAHIGYFIHSKYDDKMYHTDETYLKKLYYATNRSGRWESDYVDTSRGKYSESGGRWSHIEDAVVGVDDEGGAYMVYTGMKLKTKDSYKYSLIHAAKVGSFWKKTVIDSMVGNGGDTYPIELHGFIVKGNTRHTAYTIDNGNSTVTLKYASKQIGQEWVKKPLKESTKPFSAAFSSGSGTPQAENHRMRMMLLDQHNAIHLFSPTYKDDQIVITHGTLQ